MGLKSGGFSVTSVETWSSLIKGFLVGHEVDALESIMRFLVFVFLVVTSSSDLSVNSSELRVSSHAGDETCVFRNGIILVFNWFLRKKY